VENDKNLDEENTALQHKKHFKTFLPFHANLFCIKSAGILVDLELLVLP
jgi:hypothetical protein